MSTYKTIARPGEGLYKEKKSKFLAFSFPVKHQNEVINYIENLKKQYHDAAHHCYAYKINADEDLIRTYDDGEPAHSAGDLPPGLSVPLKPRIIQVCNFEKTRHRPN